MKVEPLWSRTKLIAGFGAASLIGLAALTLFSLQSIPDRPEALFGPVARPMILDRYGHRLTASFINEWNVDDQERLEKMPEFLVRAFVTAEDKRFFEHWGVDWRARGSAIWSGFKSLLRSGRVRRGASTITEQVVRILHPRPRTVWSRWLETFEAYELERKWSKFDILDFYLNQVPFGGLRRGVIPAARYYFGRDLETTSEFEKLALAVLVRSPSLLDPRKDFAALETRIQILAARMNLDIQEFHWDIKNSDPVLVAAPALVRRIRDTVESSITIQTTVDGRLQSFVQKLIDEQLARNEAKVEHAGMIVADVESGEVLVYASSSNTSFDINQVPRQPGSTMKPFLYALALGAGFTPASMILDEPYFTAVGRGVHPIRNYSRTHYGPVTLRQALGNSLNVPAIKMAQAVGPEKLLDLLRSSGIRTLSEPASFYGEGLALGDAEISLFELAQAYTLFANGGAVRDLKFQSEERKPARDPLVSAEVASLITHILSDSSARDLEFGRQSLLNFPYAFAVKTGTSTEYKDAWAFGYNSKIVAGVWMGNLNRQPTDGNTGAKLPMLILRSTMSELQRAYPEKFNPLDPHPGLQSSMICVSGDDVRVASEDSVGCRTYREYFLPGTLPTTEIKPIARREFEIVYPVSNMEVALDPRVPAKHQVLQFRVEGAPAEKPVVWRLNGKILARQTGSEFNWQIQRGTYQLQAEISDPSKPVASREVRFLVK